MIDLARLAPMLRLLLVPLALAASSDGGLPWPNESEYPAGQAECPQPLSDGAHTIFELGVRAFGPSPLHEQGNASTSLAWRCWEALDGDGTVLLLGRGEVHEELRIFGAEMAFSERGTCPRSRLVNRELTTANGLRLGLSRAEIERQLGQAKRSGPGWFESRCSTRRPMTDAEQTRWDAPPGAYFDVAASTRVVERAGKAVGIEIVWSETY